MKILKIVKKLILQVNYCLKLKREKTKHFSNRKNYLKAGIYFFHFNEDLFFNIFEKKSYKFYKESSKPRKKKSIKLFRIIFSTLTINLSKKQKFFGSVLLLSRRADRLIDIQNKRILSIFKEKKYFEKEKNNYKIKKYLPRPEIYHFSCKDLILIERYISCNRIKEDFLGTLIDKYSKYISEQNFDLNIRPIDYIKELEFYGKPKLGDFFLKENFDFFRKIPRINCHGDIWRNNILCSNGNYYFIDWEWYSEYFFFFDVLHFIFIEKVYYKNDLYFNNYLEGSYDKKLKELFSQVLCTYRDDEKIFFLALVVLERIIKREKHKGKGNLKREMGFLQELKNFF